MKQKRMIRFTLILIVLLLFSLVGCQSKDTTKDIYTRNFDVEKATDDFYVNDFAKLFSDTQKKEMMNKAIALDESMDGIQVVVATVKTLDSHDIEEYANAMYNQYGIGNNDMGVLIILSTDDRDVRIETGRKMEEYLTAAQSGRLLDDNGMDYFRNEQFAEGLVKVQEATIDYIKENVPSDWNSNATAVEVTSQDKGESIQNENSEKSKTFSGNLIASIFTFFVAIFAGIVTIAVKDKKDCDNSIKHYQNEISNLKIKHNENVNNLEAKYSREKNELMNQWTEELVSLRESKNAEIKAKDEEIAKLKSKLSEVTDNYQTLLDRYSRVQVLYPSADDDVSTMIENEYKKEAQDIDEQIKNASSQKADRGKIDFFKNVISAYTSASENVRKYITSDIAHVEKIQEESIMLELEYQRLEKEKRDKEEARKAYESMKKITQNISKGSQETYEPLKIAYGVYQKLTDEQKGFFPDQNWFNSFDSMWTSAKKSHKFYIEAKNAENSINEIISHIGTPDENDREKLKKAMKFYNELTPAAISFFDVALYEKIKRMLKKANDDYDEQEARRRRRREEERRHRSSYHSSSSSHHSSGSYGGHGGISHGGGASRHF